MQTKKNRQLIIPISLFLVTITFATYFQVIYFDFLPYDTLEYVSNDVVKKGISLQGINWALTTTHFSNWHPLTWISHMLDVQLFGLTPGYHHMVNLVIHAMNTIILFLLFNKMTRKALPSILLAGLFALHPLHIQSVAWVAERKDLLSTFFCLLAIGTYVAYTEKKSAKHYMLTFIFFSLGLMSKPMVVTFPCILLLLDYWPLNRFASPFTSPPVPDSNSYKILPTRLFAEKLPFFFLSILSSAVTFYAQKTSGAMASLGDLSWPSRITNAIISYISYLGKTFSPINLSIVYPYTNDTSLLSVLLAAILLIGISSIFIYNAKRFPFFIVGWLWFLGTLVPVIGLIQVGTQAMADRYTYIPLIGIFIIIAWGIDSFFNKKFLNSILFPVFIATLLLLTAAATHWQLLFWKDSETLFTRAISITQGNFVAHNNLGYTYIQNDNLEKSKFHFQRALDINKNFEIAHLNLGRIFVQEGNIQLGMQHYARALALNPGFADAHNNMGKGYVLLGENRKGAQHFHQAIIINPSHAQAYNNLGAILAIDGHTDKAIVFFQKALDINPDYEDAKTNLKNMQKANTNGGHTILHTK